MLAAAGATLRAENWKLVQCVTAPASHLRTHRGPRLPAPHISCEVNWLGSQAHGWLSPQGGRGAPGGSGGSLTEDWGGVPRSKPSGPSAFQGQDVPPSSCRTTRLVLLTASPARLCTPEGSPSTLFPYGAADWTQLRGLLPAPPWRWALTAPPVPWEAPRHEASWGSGWTCQVAVGGQGSLPRCRK